MKKKWLLMVMALAMSASMAACDFGFTSSESNSEAPVESSSPASSIPESTDSGESVEQSSETSEDTTSEDLTSSDSESGSTSSDSTPEESTSSDSTSSDSSSEGDEPVGPIVETYLVKFVDSEGNVLSEAWLEEGEMPEAPTNVTIPEDTDYVTYTGAWDKEIEAVTGAVTYTWVITENKVMVTVTFDGANETQVAKGEMVNAPSMQQPGKVVSGWKVDGEAVDLSTYVVTAPVNFESVWAEVPYATSGENYMNACELPDAPGKWYYEIGSQETVLDWTVALPTMAYEEGKTVTYNWVGGAWILVGINGKYVQGQGVGSEGTISITNVGGVLVVTIENTANPATVSGSINDQDVIAGNKPLTLSVNNGARYNQFFLSKDATVTDSTIKVETFVVDYLGNKEIATEKDGVITYHVSDKHGDADNGKFGDILIPKMDYTQNQCVTLNWTLSGWTMFGVDTSLWFMAQGEAVNGTATLTYNEKDGTLTALVESNGVGYSYQWTDRDIIEGRKSVDFGFYAWSPQMIFISDIKVVESVTVTFDGGYEQKVVIGSTVTPPDIPAPVGKVFNCWTLNGEKVDFTTFVATENVDIVSVWDEVPYAESAVGAALNASYGAATEGYWWFRVGEFDAAVWTVNLPKQAYTDGKMTTFNWIFGDWCKIGFAEGNWLNLPGNQSANGTLTVTNNGGTLTLVLTNDISGESLTTTITDADVVAGNKALTLTINAGAPYRHFNITNGVEGEIPVIPEEPETPVVNSVFAGAKTIYADGTTADASLEENKATFIVKNGEEALIALPCMDYTKYNVTFNWAESNGYVLFGYNKDWYFNAGPAYYGTATLTYASGTLTLVMNSPVEGGGERTYSITAEDIINGTAPLTFTYMGWADGSIVFSDLVMTEVEAPVEPEVPAAPYTFEGAATWAGETKQADASIGEDKVSFNTIMNGVRATLTVAKVDFTKYTYVTFNWSLDDWMMFGYGSDLWFSCTGAAQSGTATMTYADGVITLAMSNGTDTHTVTITDADVINGKKAFTLSAEGYADYRNARITAFAVAEEAPAAPFTFEGAATWAGETKQSDASIGEDSVSFSNVMNATFSTLQLATVDFTKYSQVTFNWTSSDWILVGYGSDLWFAYTGAGEKNGTVTMIYADGQITFTMASGDKSYSATITDADIINGKKAFAINAQGYADYQWVQVTNFTVTK